MAPAPTKEKGILEQGKEMLDFTKPGSKFDELYHRYPFAFDALALVGSLIVLTAMCVSYAGLTTPGGEMPHQIKDIFTFGGMSEGARMRLMITAAAVMIVPAIYLYMCPNKEGAHHALFRTLSMLIIGVGCVGGIVLLSQTFVGGRVLDQFPETKMRNISPIPGTELNIFPQFPLPPEMNLYFFRMTLAAAVAGGVGCMKKAIPSGQYNPVVKGSVHSIGAALGVAMMYCSFKDFSISSPAQLVAAATGLLGAFIFIYHICAIFSPSRKKEVIWAEKRREDKVHVQEKNEETWGLTRWMKRRAEQKAARLAQAPVENDLETELTSARYL